MEESFYIIDRLKLLNDMCKTLANMLFGNQMLNKFCNNLNKVSKFGKYFWPLPSASFRY